MSFDTLHAALDSLKKSSSTGYGAVQNMKTSPPNSVRNDDDFAELGPLLSSRSKSNDRLPQQKHEVLLPPWQIILENNFHPMAEFLSNFHLHFSLDKAMLGLHHRPASVMGKNQFLLDGNFHNLILVKQESI